LTADLSPNSKSIEEQVSIPSEGDANLREVNLFEKINFQNQCRYSAEGIKTSI
jgi:hypothetical protein